MFMEGVVIKVNKIKKQMNFAPFMKVRNPNYLSIIYNYDYIFPKKYEKLLKQKNIKNKLAL